jgi:hypothetical protein
MYVRDIEPNDDWYGGFLQSGLLVLNGWQHRAFEHGCSGEAGSGLNECLLPSRQLLDENEDGPR